MKLYVSKMMYSRKGMTNLSSEKQTEPYCRAKLNKKFTKWAIILLKCSLNKAMFRFHVRRVPCYE